jgi:two-component system sensor histidine kinase KdpD
MIRKAGVSDGLPNQGWVSGARSYGVALGAVMAALGAAAALRPLAGLENVDLILLMAVVAVAATQGLGPALVAALTSAIAYNFFFIPPTLTFEVADPTNVIALVLFLTIALITGNLAARVRAQAIAARRQAQITEALYDFSRSIADLTTKQALAVTATRRLADLLSRDALLLLPNAQGLLQVEAASNENDWIEGIEFEALRASWTGGEWAERGALRLGPRLYYPLRAGSGLNGAIGLSREGVREPLSLEEERMFAALAGQIAAALDRVRLAQERDQAKVAAEGERLRTALLSSLSHDLKTPLASITGAVTALRQDPDLYDAAARDDLTVTIQEEAERMTRFVTNLLDMTRLGTGGLVLAREPADVGEVIATALQRTAGVLTQHKVIVQSASDIPLLDLDPVLLEQALVNLLDNAAKYAPPGTLVSVLTGTTQDGVTIRIEDEGAGLPADDLVRIFDPFYRAERGDRQRAGTGLGLTICRGFVEALGGTILASNRADRSGAVFTLSFPHALVVALGDMVE